MAKLDDVIQRDTFANRPAAGVAGRLFYATDTKRTYRDNGAAWDEYDQDAFSNPMTTQGDVITGGASGAANRLAIGAAGQLLTVNAGATAPEWADPNSKQKFSDDDVSDPPSDAELDAAFGAPGTLGEGFVGVLDDDGGAVDCYLCWTDGTAWFYVKGTKAV